MQRDVHACCHSHLENLRIQRANPPKRSTMNCYPRVWDDVAPSSQRERSHGREGERERASAVRPPSRDAAARGRGPTGLGAGAQRGGGSGAALPAAGGGTPSRQRPLGSETAISLLHPYVQRQEQRDFSKPRALEVLTGNRGGPAALRLRSHESPGGERLISPETRRESAPCASSRSCARSIQDVCRRSRGPSENSEGRAWLGAEITVQLV